jgi:hypothetical protein
MIRQEMKSICTRVVVVLAVAAFSPACAPLRLPYKGGGKVASPNGVEVAVSRQSCTQNVDPDFYGEDLVEEVVEVQVRNATSNALTVQRDAFQLISPDGYGLKTVTWRAVDPLPLIAGETKSFELRFMTRGLLYCSREMKLDADAGVRMNGRPIELGAISFQPSRAL